MKLIDNLTCALLMVMLLLSAIVGVANLTSSILAAEIPALIDRPALAYLISLILPTAAVALEYCSTLFKTAHARHLFERILAIATTLSIAGWLVCFSLNFVGLSSAFDISDPASSTGTLYVFLQTSSELLIASVLCCAIRKIFAKYVITVPSKNPAYAELKEAWERAKKECAALQEELDEREGRQKQLLSQCKVLIDEKSMRFTAIRLGQIS